MLCKEGGRTDGMGWVEKRLARTCLERCWIADRKGSDWLFPVTGPV